MVIIQSVQYEKEFPVSEVEEDFASEVKEKSVNVAAPQKENAEPNDDKAHVREIALTKLKQLEEKYYLLNLRIIEQRKADLCKLEEMINMGSHAAIESDLQRIEAEYELSSSTSKRRYEVTCDMIESQHKTEVSQINREFIIKRAKLRSEMVKETKEKVFNLEKDNKVVERRISKGKMNILDSILEKASVKNRFWRAYPVLQEFNMRRRQNLSLLVSYCAREDEFGDFVPPPLRPNGLSEKELEADYALLFKKKYDEQKPKDAGEQQKEVPVIQAAHQ